MKTTDQTDCTEQNAVCAANGMAERMATFKRISWREALGGIVSPAFRLHRIRSTQNRVLLDALCELDCSDDTEHAA